jgi:hypothetical protein
MPPIAVDISVNKFNELAHLRGIEQTVSSVRSVRINIVLVKFTAHGRCARAVLLYGPSLSC